MTKKTKEELRAEIHRVFPDSQVTDMFSTPEQVLWYVQQLQTYTDILTKGSRRFSRIGRYIRGI